MAEKLDVAINYTHEQLKELAAKIDGQLEKGVPMKDALKQSGVPEDVYFAFKKKMLKVEQLNAGRAAKRERMGPNPPKKKRVVYKLDTFMPVYEEAERLKREGMLSPDVYKKLDISPATYNKWKKKVIEKQKADKEAARLAKQEAKAAEPAPAPQKPVQSAPQISPAAYAEMRNENKELRDIVADLNIEIKRLKRMVTQLGGSL